ncbi:ABC transporter ATP-binding protein [Aestuariimicrobium ganziense]|uniref:ABC transporter ATP-binding protein n=1 Tax=Aestuariimicrobium ganziense TaxID=2773677 RepID=UPI00194295CD|nr:ABC transporter ATP-binding protein [Aestuariimicrobium ganziense]
MITAESWGWRHAGRKAWAVRNLDLTIDPGERVLLLGASGSGKSTRLPALAGVLGSADEGESTGTMLVKGKHPTRQKGLVALVQQDPEAAVVLHRVGDDVAFGLENLQVPPDQIWPRVSESLEAVGLDVALNRPTSALSGGQKQRLALAGAIAMHAEVLLLDEPTANLDPEGIDEVRGAVGRLVADRRTTLIVVEHRVQVWADLVDRVVVLARDGGLLADGPPLEVFHRHRDALLEAGVWVPGAPLPVDGDGFVPRDHPTAPDSADFADPVARNHHERLLTTADLTIGRHAQHPVQRHLDLTIPAATSTVVTGPNGVGKSTLALTLAGLLEPLSGEVIAAPAIRPPAARRSLMRRVSPPHPITWRSRDLLTRIGTVFQQPEHQFVAATVADEIAVGLRALGTPTAEVTARTDELLEVLHLTRLARANPFTLSGGEKRRLSVGTVLATQPAVILLDEPTFGQDRNTWAELVRLVRASVDEGRAVVSVTHDQAYLSVLAQHRIALTGGPDRHDDEATTPGRAGAPR